MLNQLKARTQAQNASNLKDSLIDYTYDPTRQHPSPYKTVYQPTPSDGYARNVNTSLKHSQQQTTTTHPMNVDNLSRQKGLSTHPTLQMREQIKEKHEKQDRLERVAARIHIHFKTKYPALIDASGFNAGTILKIVEQISSKTRILDEKAISKIIDIIDHKFKTTTHSENLQGKQWNTTGFSMDTESKIPMEKYLENYSNKVDILLDSSKRAIEADLPKAMAPINDTIPIEKSEPFSEDFPSRDREKQSDMMIPEIREYDYYITIDSKDRDPTKYPNPNDFVIEFAPAAPTPGSGETRKGYIDRGLGNVKSCELMNVIVRDVSDQPDSSDASSASYPYLLLQFDELQTNYFGTNNNITRSFAILSDYSKIGQYRYYHIIGDKTENTVSRVYNPRINLNKLTTRLLLPNGSPFNFGSAFTDDTSNTCITMSFRFTTIQKNLATQFINKATY
jgi:hypothetical protein